MSGPSVPPSTAAARRAVWIRLLVSPLLLGLVLAVLWIHDRTSNPLATDLLLLLVGGAGALEMARLLGEAKRPVLPWLAAAGSALVAGVGLLAPWDEALRTALRPLLVAAVVLAALLVHLLDTRREALDRIAFTLLPPLCVGLFLSWGREIGLGPQQARHLVWLTVVAKASDIGGYLVGKPLGRHKLVPSLSPAKSWEGLAGGLAASVLAALLLPALLDAAPTGFEPASWSEARRALFGLAVGAAATLAGLVHSGFKRRVGAKDSSPLLPEIGGVLDIVDSMLLACPVAWAWFALGL